LPLNLRPDFYVLSLDEIPILKLKEKGIRGLIIDLDNTLTNWNCHNIEPCVYKWLMDLNKLGFKTCIVSNNGAKRIEATLVGLNVPFVANALKPRKRGFLKAMELMDCQVENTAIIGDQLFTDILGGKRVGITTILVAPRSKKEFFGTKFTRLIERMVLSKMNKK
jgi:HAD superfamily phosphatase (TIGR01668 family)